MAKRPVKRKSPPSPPPWSEEAKALGSALRARRKSLRLTQAELARFAGCGLAYLYELEAGKTTLRLDKLLDVLLALGLRLRLERGPGTLLLEDAQPGSDAGS